MKHKAIICDLDGNLALLGDRSPYATQDCMQDTLNEPIADILRMCYRDEGYLILLLTGRYARYQQQTLNWLETHGVFFDILYMRNDGDNRPDTVVKQEIYENQIKPTCDVQFVLEDRTRCVKMWRSLGLCCLQVADGEY